MKLQNIIPFVALGCITLVMGCGGEPEEVAYDYDRSDSLSSDYLRALGNVRVSIEESAKLNNMLKEAGYSYNNSFLNSPSKASGYSNSKQQAFNLGVYGADLSYASLFEQTQDAMGYVKAIVQLSDKLGIAKAFDENLLTQMAENDSTINKSILLTKAYINAEDQLHSEDRAQLATLMVVGGWIEGLYISTSAVKEKPAGGNISAGIWNQAYSFENVENMLKVFESSSPDCAELLKDVDEIRTPVNRIVQTHGDLKPDHVAELNQALAGLRSKHM